MSLRVRLILSYVAMVIMPIILSIIAVFIITIFFVRSVAGAYNIKITANPYEQIVANSIQVFKDIESVAAETPIKLEDETYLAELDSKLNKINTNIVVRKQDKIIYSSKNLTNSSILKSLPKFGEGEKQERRNVLVDGEHVLKQQDFYFPDKTDGSLFLVINIKPVEKIIARYFFSIIIAIILILILTDGLLTYLVSRSILTPIKTLRNAANQIKEGNLNFEVKVKSRDEIGELCSDFEEMRFKLKESVDMQLQYENNRKELISNISHDLKTPITAIKGYVEGIIDGVADSPEKIDRYIKTIYVKASDIDRMIEELFLFSKLDLNRVPFDFEKIDIREYLKDCVEELQLDMEKKGFTLSFYDKLKAETLVLADRERLKRVIINIVGNAVKYSNKENGEVNITLDEHGDKIVIKIEDNGQGIPEKDVPFIFERFYRADASRNTSTGGSGLGLAIAKMIIEEHGGNIWAESKENYGTSIFFTLRRIQLNKGSDFNEENTNN